MTFWSLTNSDFPTNQTFHQFHDLDTELDLHRLWVVSMEHLQRVWHASRERLPLRTPGSVPFFGGLACALIVETSFPDSSPIKWPTEVDFYRIEVSMEHLRQVWHASRERLPFRTPGSVPILGLANAPIVETNSSNLPCLYSTFYLEYPLVLSRFCSYTCYGIL